MNNHVDPLFASMLNSFAPIKTQSMTIQELEDKFEEIFDKHTAPTGGGYEADSTDRARLWEDFLPVIIEFAKTYSHETH